MSGPDLAYRLGWRRGTTRDGTPRDGSARRSAVLGVTADPGAQAGPARPFVGPPELERRREELVSRFAQLQWDLGGIAYEMARREHYRLDVLTRRAAELQQVDGELGEVERMLRLERAGAAGTCPACGALHAAGAGFCWQCGTALMPAAEGNGSR